MRMDNKVLFSVLIANYNNGLYLEDAINSVHRQTYNNWEIVIVDDCSTDNSNELYDKYEKDSRIRIYYNDCNHGCGYTKRRCAELAKGEICGFLDPDDTLEPDALEIMVSEHLKDESLSMVYSRYNEVDEHLNFIRVSNQQQDIPENSSFLEGSGGISHFVTFKTVAYRKTPGIDASFLRAVDHDMYYMLEEVGNVKFVDKVLYNYRTNTGLNISLGGNENKAYLWHIIGMVDACRRRGLPIEDIVFVELESWHEQRADQKSIEAVKKVLNTTSFKVGNFILKPFVGVLSLLRMSIHKG